MGIEINASTKKETKTINKNMTVHFIRQQQSQQIIPILFFYWVTFLP